MCKNHIHGVKYNLNIWHQRNKHYKQNWNTNQAYINREKEAVMNAKDSGIICFMPLTRDYDSFNLLVPLQVGPVQRRETGIYWVPAICLTLCVILASFPSLKCKVQGMSGHCWILCPWWVPSIMDIPCISVK